MHGVISFRRPDLQQQWDVFLLSKRMYEIVVVCVFQINASYRGIIVAFIIIV